MTEEQVENKEPVILKAEDLSTVSIPMNAFMQVVYCNNCDQGTYRRNDAAKMIVGESVNDSGFPFKCTHCADEVYLPATAANISYENANIDASRSTLRDQFGHSGVIALIWARTYNHGIGHKDDLPWGRDYPTDLKWFQSVTKHNPNALMVVGRSTYENLPELPDRKFAVLTTSVSEKTACGRDGDFYYPDIPTLINDQADTDLIVIGGGSAYQQWFPMADVVYETIIYGNYPSDTHGPILNADKFTNLDTYKVDDCDGTGKPVVFNIWLSNRAKGSLEEHIIRERWNFKVSDMIK